MNEEEKNLNEEETTEVQPEETAEETVETSQTVEEPIEESENSAETPEEIAEESVADAVEAKSAETVIGGEESQLDSSDVMAVGDIAEDGTVAAAAAEAEIAEDGTVTDEAQTATVADAKNQALAKTAAIIVGAVILAAIIVLGIMFGPKLFNKYNRSGYIDVSGKTIGEVADNSGMSLEDFLESFGLPKDMPSNTAESVAYYFIPAGKIAPMYRMDFETLKTTLGLPDEITEDTPWGEAEGEAKLSNYVGDLDEFKEKYGLGDEITGDTKWKEVRNIVDERQREENKEQEKEAKKAEKEAAKKAEDDSKTDDTETAETTEAPEEAAASPEAKTE